MDGWSFDKMVTQLYTEEIADYCGTGKIRVPSREYKTKRFQSLRRLALAEGIDLRFCRCKNSPVTQDLCHDLPRALKSRPPQCTLFDQRTE